MSAASTPWQAGRFDRRAGTKRILFGRMYEDPEIERSVFRPGERIFCIASAGCTALALCGAHEVVACDINPAQLAYAERRIAGAPVQVGTAEKVMQFGRTLAPIAGWTAGHLAEFLALTDPAAQLAFFREHLATWRFRMGFDSLLSITALRAVYAPEFLDFLPARFGAVLRARLERGFGRHPNASNPYARLLLLGDAEPAAAPSPEAAARITLVESDAAAFLESSPPGSFEGFTLSNILDGARREYRTRLFAAIHRAARPGAHVVLRSFGEPTATLAEGRAADDRSMLWGVVSVRRAEEL